MIQKFEEVLNDGWNCFLLGDPYTLLKFKKENNLPDNLQTVFTTSDSGDEVVKKGAVIYLYNLKEPHDEGFTVYFNYNDKSIFEECSILPTHYVQGYIAEVTSGKISLYIWSCLYNYTEKTAEQILELSKSESNNPIRQSIDLPNGWYQIDVKVGYIKDNPAIEFLIKQTTHRCVQVDLNALVSYDFELSQ